MGKPVEIHGRLILVKAGGPRTPWAQNIWENPERISFRSISDAATKLKNIQRNWLLYSVESHRRATLIQEALPHISFKKIRFGDRPPTAPLGSWTLLDANTLLASPRCSSPYPHGELHFEEDKISPPSRAYLKLWEAFTLFGDRPKRGERCYDAGASPGGWTWVLAEAGAKVVAVDRSPLAPELMRNPRVEFVQGNAFSKEHDRRGPYDWIFSDVACYPDKLYEWVVEKLKTFPNAKFICTLKFQEKDGYASLRKFQAIEGSQLIHLSCNKHELTWAFGLPPLVAQSPSTADGK